MKIKSMRKLPATYLSYHDCDMLWKKEPFLLGDHCGRDLMVVGFTTIYAINTYHH
jgi:hypothetical protein